MNLIKKSKMLIILLLSTFIFTGCVHQINKDGLVLSLSESELSDSFKDSFPFKQNFVFGDLSLTSPKIKMTEKDRIHAGIDLGLKTLFTSSIRGDFSISGEPIFNKEDSSIYLQNVIVEEFKFGRLKMGDEFTDTFRSSLQPMVNEIFKKYPIYKIPEDSMQGSFVKDIKVENSKLLVTYGL